MGKKSIVLIGIIMILCLFIAMPSYAAQKAKNYWQSIYNYIAGTTERSVDVVTDAAKKGTRVVTKEIRRIGEVTSGDVSKTKELVVEPLEGAAKTAVDAAQDASKIPFEDIK